jgi:hypothetical protein
MGKYAQGESGVMSRARRWHIQVGRSIDASSTTVWQLLTDTRCWTQWGPSIVAVDCGERFIRPGSRGRIKTWFGFWLPFVITDYQCGCYWHWLIGGIAATGHRVEPLQAEQCQLTFEVPIWAAPYSIICIVALQRIAQLSRP